MWGSIVGSLQRTVSRSRMGVSAAIKLKRQCDSVIGARLNSGILQESNGEAWLASKIAPSADFFVDVGANVGTWSLLFAAMMRAPRGLLFEPAPATVHKLRDAIEHAGLANLAVVASAVGDACGEATFQAEADYGETSSLIAGHSRLGSKSVTVPITTLDVELANRDINSVDFLKIDAEGYDLRVLIGAERLLQRQGIKVIQFEYNHPWAAAGSTLVAAYRLLEGNGYKMRLLKEDGLHVFDPTRTGEFFRYSNFVAYCSSQFEEMIESSPHQAIV